MDSFLRWVVHSQQYDVVKVLVTRLKSLVKKVQVNGVAVEETYRPSVVKDFGL